MKTRLHPSAKAEMAKATKWYAKQSAEAARSFVAEVERSLGIILVAPNLWEEYLSGTRRFLVRRFPYLIVYSVVDDTLNIWAVSHARRKPGYWRRRLKS